MQAFEWYPVCIIMVDNFGKTTLFGGLFWFVLYLLANLLYSNVRHSFIKFSMAFSHLCLFSIWCTKLNIAGSKNLFWLKECGWEDQLRLHAKDVVREKGLERIKLEELTKEITPKVEKVKMSSEEFIKKFFLAILAHSSWLYICILAENLYYLQTKNIKKLNFILNMILNKLK